MNMYAYVANDPINNTDPTGKFCIPCVTATIGVVVGEVASAYSSIKNGDGVVEVLTKTLAGAVTGAVVASGVGLAVEGSALAATVGVAAINTVGGAVDGALTQHIENGFDPEIDPLSDEALAAVGEEAKKGAVLGNVGGKVAKLAGDALGAAAQATGKNGQALTTGVTKVLDAAADALASIGTGEASDVLDKE